MIIPILQYPNGGETLLTPEINITWDVDFTNSDGSDVSFELYYTDQYDATNEPDWKLIAVLPDTVSHFVWTPNSVQTNKARIAIRARGVDGERSPFSISASNFSIGRRKLAAPTVISPISGERYDQYITIQTDDSAILGTYSQRTYYQFFYSSNAAGIPSTPIAQNIPIGSDPILWNITDLPAAKDYVLEVYISDESGSTSEKVFVDIEISHEGYFILDTTAPESAIKINNNAAFTKKRDVSVEIVSYDATTAVHSMQLIEGETKSRPDAVGNVRSFQLSPEDAIKTIQLLLQDFGGNRNNENPQRLFQVLLELTDGEVVDIALDKSTGTLWAVTDGPSSKFLYKVKSFASRQASFSNSPTAVSFFAGKPYVATRTSDSKAVIYTYASGLEVAYTFTDFDSVVNCMETYGSNLYLGMENGKIYSCDSSGFSLVQEMPNPVKNLVSDGNLLYAVLKNDQNVYIYTHTEFITSD